MLGQTMKIRVLIDHSGVSKGTVVDAVVSKDKSNAVFFSEDNLFWHITWPSFEIVEQAETQTKSGQSLIDTIGAKPSKIEIVF